MWEVRRTGCQTSYRLGHSFIWPLKKLAISIHRVSTANQIKSMHMYLRETSHCHRITHHDKSHIRVLRTYGRHLQIGRPVTIHKFT